ncbi:Gfo/Idh/MocA family oxidoreductase [candidate division NPL-UPA2 bacterium]|nr:Gfo/Idh/MocA family oxidoreductase [candidate division NPL-UPA2 bacterium]
MAVKWGVIGAGGIADRRTIPEGITKAKNAALVAVMDVDEAKAKEVGSKYKVKHYLNEGDLLNDKEVEAVYIATPVHLHAKQTLLAAEAGKHILCEKSMALTVEECQDMIDACRRNKVKLAIGFMMRFHAYHHRAREMVAEGRLGKVVLGRAQLSCWYPPIEGAWRQDPKLGGGGPLIDMGSHCIDLLEFILDSRVREVCCLTGTLAHNYPVEDSATVLLRFENGAQGTADNFFSIPDASSKNRLEIYGTKGSILAEGTLGQMATGEMTAYLEKEQKGYEAKQERATSSTERIELTPINMYQAEVEHFSDCIVKDLEPAISGEDGLWSQKVVLACYESAKTGKLVEVK